MTNKIAEDLSRVIPAISKDAWDAAMSAARAMMNGHPSSPIDRAAYRNARARLVGLLPDGADVDAVIRSAVNWNTRDCLAASIAMMGEAA